MRSSVDHHGRRLRLVPVGLGAERIRSGRSTGENLFAGVLGAYRVCVWAPVYPAKKTMQHREGHSRVAGNFRGYDAAIDLADQLETKKCGSAARKIRGCTERQRSSLEDCR